MSCVVAGVEWLGIKPFIPLLASALWRDNKDSRVCSEVALSFLAKGYLILPIIIPFKILIFLFLFDGAVAGGS